MTSSGKIKTKRTPTKEAGVETVISYKGFDQNLQCRGFQYEVGKTYEHDGDVEICASGFQACEHPLDVFRYYTPALSRFAVVEQVGPLSREDSGTKITSAKITIQAEIHISEIIQRAVKWIFDRAKPEGESSHATGNRGAASATGNRGAASATGYSGAASATGDSGAASATGYGGAASATGDGGAAMASGRDGQTQGANGCALFLVRRDNEWNITHAWAGIVGKNGIKPLTWYTLNENGEPVEVVS